MSIDVRPATENIRDSVCESLGISFWSQDGCYGSKSIFMVKVGRQEEVGQHQKYLLLS